MFSLRVSRRSSAPYSNPSASSSTSSSTRAPHAAPPPMELPQGTILSDAIAAQQQQQQQHLQQQQQQHPQPHPQPQPQQQQHKIPNVPPAVFPVPSRLSAALSIWEGHLSITGRSRAMTLRCIAISHAVIGLPPVQGTAAWPKTVICTPDKLQPADGLRAHNAGGALQWLVRFVPVDENSQEIVDSRLSKIASIIEARNAMYRIECNARAHAIPDSDTTAPSNGDCLYILGATPFMHNPSLFAVFSPGGHHLPPIAHAAPSGGSPVGSSSSSGRRS